jgi:hypothetical protein
MAFLLLTKRQTRFVSAVLKSLIFWCLCSLAQAESPPPDVDTLLASMVRAYTENRSQLRGYVITRNYLVFRAGEQKSSITALIIYLPPKEKMFEIQSSSGGRAEGVVRRVLEKEMQIGRDVQDTGINVSNYEFEFLGEESLADGQCYVLAIHPRRKSKDLLEGKIWLDKELRLIRRVQGRPGKSPSWWVKDVSLTLDYGDRDKMWLQTGSTAEASVHFAGKYRLVSQTISFALLEAAAP